MSGIIFLESFKDAFSDLVPIVPLLFLTFLVIEFVEYYQFDKVSSYVRRSGKYAPLIGALVASFPQCGFSIIASVLYIRGLITRGTLLAVYLSTSDEAIPVLLSMPDKSSLVIPVILIKILIGIIAGYAFDFIFPKEIKEDKTLKIVPEVGCCEHNIGKKIKKELILHPVVHTFTISIFIFVLTLIINILIALFGSAENLGVHLMSGSIVQPFMAALFGLIPNCAVSVALIMLFIKGSITFSSLIAGLCSNSGLGIWIILTRNKDKKDSLILISALFLISALAGVIIYLTKFAL